MAETIDSVDRLPNRRVLGIIALWTIALAIGFAILIDHDLRAGSSGTAMHRWPAASSLTRSEVGPTLVMFIHPHCPCTAASLEQLDSIVRDAEVRSTRIHVLVADVSDFERGENTIQASRIAGAEVQRDANDAEARRFGCHTSGELFLYSVDGELVFQGGITAARGHAGENAAAVAAQAAIEGTSGKLVQMPTFGCALVGKDAAPAQALNEWFSR